MQEGQCRSPSAGGPVQESQCRRASAGVPVQEGQCRSPSVGGPVQTENAVTVELTFDKEHSEDKKDDLKVPLYFIHFIPP